MRFNECDSAAILPCPLHMVKSGKHYAFQAEVNFGDFVEKQFLRSLSPRKACIEDVHQQHVHSILFSKVKP